MDGLEVRQWVRYGHDRSYVRTSGGALLGHRDNRTGVVTVDELDRSDLVVPPGFDLVLGDARTG